MNAIIVGAVAAAAHVLTFGPDPMRDKIPDGIDAVQSDRVARVVDEAEGYLAAMTEIAATTGDHVLQRRVERFADSARQMCRTVEDDPRDLTAARKYLIVYLKGARDATAKFADIHARNPLTETRAEYFALIDDLESNFAARTSNMLLDDRSDLDVEIEVLRDRLRRDGVRVDRQGMDRMDNSVRQAAEGEAPQIREASEIDLPEPSTALVPLAQADPDRAEAIRSRMAEIDLADTNSIVAFGSAAQEELQQISQSMLADVKNKDVGPAGDSLRDMVTTIRGFSVSELDVRRERSWWEKLLGRTAPFANFLSKFEGVQGQIDKITNELLQHEHTLLKDIKSLDQLYDKTLNFYEELGLYITAGEEKLAEMDATTIPAKEAEVAEAPEDAQVMRAQELRDLRAARDDLERRVHDLKLTRQVTMQSLPSIRLVQENDKSLVTKINSTLVNTVPLWETQLAQSVTIQRSSEAAAAVREANDLTNELLTANAANLRESNKTIRQEMERGVFDIEAVKQANADLIATINESLQIADEGKARRAAAETEMEKMEAELRQTLAAASGRRDGTAATAGDAAPAG